MYDSITIQTGNDEMEIKFQEMGEMNRMRFYAKLPDQFHEVARAEDIEMNEALIDYTVELIEHLTVLDESMLNALPTPAIQRLMEAAFCVLGDVPMDVPERRTSSDYRVDDNEIDFNEDGAVELEDWR